MLHLLKQLLDSNISDSTLYDQRSFYPAFLDDLRRARCEVIMESPFITHKRLSQLLPDIRKLVHNGVKVVINTRDPQDGTDAFWTKESAFAVARLQSEGVTVLYTVGHHRKLAIIDSKIIWEGSLNILSYSDSCEIMRRVSSTIEAKQLIKFLNLEQYL